MDSGAVRDTFFEEYKEFYNGGPVPQYASNDFAYFLECHRKRLEDKGIQVVKRIDRIGDNIDSKRFKSHPPYTLHMTFKECNYETDYMKDGQLLARSDKDTETLYCDILDKQDYQEETISCPNCGHSAGAKSFINGCTMCGTRFKTFKFFPCVTTFHTIPKFVERNKIEGSIKKVIGVAVIFGVLVALGVFLYNWLAEGNLAAGIFFGIIGGLISGWLGCIIFYLLYSLILAIVTFSKMASIAADTMDLSAAQMTKKRFENDMSRYFPDFSYEYFEGKLIALLRSIIFSDDRSNLSIYKGHDNLDYMNNVVDVEYRGACKYEGSTLVDDILHVRMVAYVTCTVYENGKLTKHQASFKTEVIRRLKNEEDLGFSVHAVNCKTCGATFDAMHIDKCPHCGHSYELIDDDWVMIFINR